MKSLPQEYVLLKKISSYVEEYFAMPESCRIARSTDIYDFLRHKADFSRYITSGVHFSQFIREMYNRGVLTQFIKNVTVDTSNKNFYQWYFYPPERSMKRETTEEDANVASSHPDTSDFFKVNKIHIAANGTIVRSIQELNILNRLLAVDFFDVYYERPLTAGGDERFPDFPIYNKKNDTVFHWEHFGMLNNVAYDEKMTEKIEWYKRIGYRSIEEGGRLIISSFNDEAQFIGHIESIIEKIKTISIPCGFFRQ